MPRPIRFVRINDTDPSRAIVDQVRARVQKGQLAEGDRLPPEREFAEQLGVSRNTVRKAVNALAQGGLVTVKKGATGGAFISQGAGGTMRTAMLDLYHLGGVQPAELTEARMVLSQSVVRLACERCTGEDIEVLEANVEAAEAAIARGDIAARMALNIEFYRLLAVASRNRVLTLMMDSVGHALLQFVRVAGLVPPDTIMPVRRQILACMRKRDAEGAVKAITSHLLQLERNYAALGQLPADARRP